MKNMRYLLYLFLLCLLGCANIPAIEEDEYIAYDSVRPCPGQSDIYILNLNSKKEIRLTFTKSIDEFCPSWSPDGEKLIFVSHPAKLYLIDFKKGKLKELKTPQINGAICFSANSKRIIFANCEENKNFELYAIDINGKHLRRLTYTPDFQEDDPSCSPDGKKIVFRVSIYDKEKKDKEGIYTMDVENGSLTNLTKLTGDGESPSYSPDGKKMIFYSKREGDKSAKIYIMDANEPKSAKRLIENNQQNIHAELYPSWSPDGNKVLFTGYIPDPLRKGPGNMELFIVNSDGSNLQRLTYSDPSLARYYWSSWRPCPKSLKDREKNSFDKK
ncbi:MAG: hypothetical protein AB1297_07150 [bacterium]